MKLRRDRMRLYAVTDKSWLKPGKAWQSRWRNF